MGKDEKLNPSFMEKSSTEILPDEYISYTRRWFVLLSVVALNLAGALVSIVKSLPRDCLVLIGTKCLFVVL